jgi:distribution and morphology protein 34
VVEESIPEETESSVIAEAATPSSKVRFRSAEEAGRPPVMANLQSAQQMGSPLKHAVQPPGPQEYSSIAAATSGFKTEKGKHPGLENQSVSSESSSVILEQAWIMKMAGEIAKRVYDEKNKHRSPWDEEREDAPPPAYEAATR